MRLGRLTPKQEAFCLAIVTSPDGNASVAYRSAYPSATTWTDNTVYVEASRLLKNPKVVLRLAELRATALQAADLTATRTMLELKRLLVNDPRKFFTDDGSMKQPHEWDDDMAAAVASIEVLEEYEGRGEDRRQVGWTKKIKFWDKNAAIDKAMKHIGLFERDNRQKTENLAIQINLVGSPDQGRTPAAVTVQANLVDGRRS